MGLKVYSRHKIGYILTPIVFGGLEKVSLNYLTYASRDKFDIRPILLTRPWEAAPFFAREIRKLGYSFETVPVAIRKSRDPFRVIRSFKRIYNLLKREGFDLIHTHGYFADICALPVSRILKIPSLSTCHGFIEGDINLKVYNRLDLFAQRLSKRVICVSDDIGNLLTRWGVPQHRIRVIQNAVAAASNGRDTSGLRERVRHYFHIAPSEIVLGYCGRLSEEKGLKYMIGAASSLAISGLPIKVLLIGDGPEREKIERFAESVAFEKRVIFTGFQENVPDLLPSIDIFVLSSLTEGTPMALLEAMAHGIPVVACAVGEIPEIISQGQDGLLVPPGQTEAIVQAVKRIVEDDRLRERLSISAIATVQRRFSLDQWVDDMEEQYLQLISQKSLEVN